MQEVVMSANPKDLGAAFRKGALACLKHCQDISEGMSSNNKHIHGILQQKKS